MEKYILSIDQGTTSSRAILVDKKGQILNIAQQEVKCFFPFSGWVEADATEIWLSVVNVVNEVLIKQGITFDNIDSIGITNQRETTVIWDKKTGNPVANAIVWQSRQTADICDTLNDKKEYIHQKTGLLINPYFSASKIRFILDAIPNGQKRAEKGELLFGTIDSWIIYKLTKGKSHVTDPSNACRTMLYNINTMTWDNELCDMLNIPMAILPTVLPSSSNFGYATFFNDKTPICGVAGDQQAALFGQACFEEGDCKNTYGTGCFMLMNTGNKVCLSKRGLLTTVAWQIGNKVCYALEGSVFIGGAVVQWLRDEMRVIKTAAESYDLATGCENTHGVYLVPAFVGLGTPYWDDDCRGAVFGLTRRSNVNHFVRAALDSIAYQCKDVYDVMVKETGCSKLGSLRVDGGATANPYLMQFQSDLLQTNILLPKSLQTTAIGAAYLAGLETGFFKNTDTIKEIHSFQAIYEPRMTKQEVKDLYNGWKKAVKATIAFK